MSVRPHISKSKLKPPRGYKKPRPKDFIADMKQLGELTASEFKDTISHNIETNRYKFQLSPITIRRKNSSLPFVDSEQLVNAIYQEGVTVSVHNSPRKDTDLTNLQVAIRLEYGRKDLRIPARPLWRNTFRDYKNVAKKHIKSFFKNGGKYDFHKQTNTQ